MRPFRASDFDAARAFAEDEAGAPWVPTLPAGDGPGVVTYFEECRREGSLLHLVIAGEGDDRYLGEVMLALGEHGVGELGCGVVPAASGRGRGTEALRLLADWGFSALGLGRIEVLVAVGNGAGLRLAERAGFRREGVLRSYWDLDGARLDVVISSRLPGE